MAEINDYPCRVAAAVDPQLKALVSADASKRRVTESTLLRDILTTYYAFFSQKAGYPVSKVKITLSSGFSYTGRIVAENEETIYLLPVGIRAVIVNVKKSEILAKELLQ